MVGVVATLSNLRKGDPVALEKALRLARPVSMSGEHRLEVLPALGPLFPGHALARGGVVSISGQAARSLGFAVAAGPSAAGSWVAVLGVPGLGVAAAAETGVELSRVVVVPHPTVEAVAAAFDAFDVVIVGSDVLTRRDCTRLQARARDRGTVVLVLGSSAIEPDVSLHVTRVSWQGLRNGTGLLTARRVTVEGGGRRAANRSRHLDLWLPDAQGQVRSVDAEVRELSHVRAG